MAKGQVLVIACGAIARELVRIRDLNGWDHVRFQCLPAKLHNTPELIPGAVRDMIERKRADYDALFVAYADCGTGGRLDRVLERRGIERLPGAHCYAFLAGGAVFDALAREEPGSFYLTDFLVRQFDAFVTRPLGLDRHPELRDAYFGHYEKLVYQAQTDDPALTEKARACADALGLAFERRFTGYGDLATALARLTP